MANELPVNMDAFRRQLQGQQAAGAAADPRFAIAERMNTSFGLTFGYGVKGPAKSSVPASIIASGTPLTGAQLDFIGKIYGVERNTLLLSGDEKSVIIPSAGHLSGRDDAKIFFDNAGKLSAIGKLAEMGKNEAQMPFALELIDPYNRSGKIGNFDVGSTGEMNKYNGKTINELTRNGVPSDLDKGIVAMGKAILERTERNGRTLARTHEFDGLNIMGADGKPDARKVGTILFLAASYQPNHNKTDGPFAFDNQLTVEDLQRLNDPKVKQFVAERANLMLPGKHNAQTMLEETLRANGALDRLQDAAQGAANSGVRPDPNGLRYRCPDGTNGTATGRCL